MSLAMIRKVFSMTAKTHAAERLMLLALADCYNQETGRCYPSVSTLRCMTGLCDKWATRTLQSLERRGFIVRKKISKPNGKGWRYLICIPERNTGVANTGVVDTGVANTPQGVYQVLATGVPSTPKREYNRNTTGIHMVSETKHRFVKPTVDEVCAYCTEQGFVDVDPGEFVDCYTAKGWTVGRSPMKDWKAAVRNWHRRNLSGGSSAPTGSVIHNASRKESDYVL